MSYLAAVQQRPTQWVIQRSGERVVQMLAVQDPQQLRRPLIGAKGVTGAEARRLSQARAHRTAAALDVVLALFLDEKHLSSRVAEAGGESPELNSSKSPSLCSNVCACSALDVQAMSTPLH